MLESLLSIFQGYLKIITYKQQEKMVNL